MNRNVFPSAVDALGWTLVHFVWQGGLIAAALLLLLSLVGRAKPNTRYLLSCMALGVMGVTATSTVAWQIARASSGVAVIGPETLGAPASVRTAPVTAVVTKEGPLPTLLPPRLGPEYLPDSAGIEIGREMLSGWLPCIVAVWGAGICLLSIRLIVGCWLIRRIRTDAEEIHDTAQSERFACLCERLGVRASSVQLLSSVRANVPFVVGWIRPAVLLPVSALMGLDARELDAILLHELAHIRRHDYLVNLAQTLIETLLFYHPVVWWVSRQIRKEREHCCDDLAAESCNGGVAVYVRALTTLEEMRRLPGVIAVAVNGASLKSRIQRLVGVNEPRPAGIALPALASLCLVAIVLSVAVARGWPGDGPGQPSVPVLDEPLVQNTKGLPQVDEAAVRGHIAALAGPDLEAWVAAASALQKLGPGAEAAIPALISALADEKLGNAEKGGDGRLGRASSLALASIGAKAVPALAAALHSDKEQVRWWAGSALQELGPKAQPAIPDLIASFDDKEHPVKQAGSILAEIGAPAMPVLLQMLNDPKSSAAARGGAAGALGAMGPKAKAAVPGLIDALGDLRDPWSRSPDDGGIWYPVQGSAVFALQGIGPEARAAVPALIKLVRDPNLQTCRYAAEALGEIGADPENAVPALILALGTEKQFKNKTWYRELTYRAAQSLGSYGPKAKDAAPYLVQLVVQMEQPGNGAAAERALGQIGVAAVPALAEGYRVADDKHRPAIIRALGGIGADKKEVLPLLLAALDDSNAEVRREALVATMTAGSPFPQAKELALIIARKLRDSDASVRSAAAGVLFTFGLEAKEAVPALTEGLNDRDSNVRKEAAWALFAIGPSAKAAILALEEAAKDRDKQVRIVAARALERIQSGVAIADPEKAMIERFRFEYRGGR